MRNPLLAILRTGTATQREPFPDLPEAAAGLPTVTEAPCSGVECRRCVEVCPTEAIQVTEDAAGGVVTLDRGRCIGCAGCVDACPSGTLAADRSTRTAVRTREELVPDMAAALGEERDDELHRALDAVVDIAQDRLATLDRTNGETT